MPKLEYSTSDWQAELLKCYSHEPEIALLPKEVLIPDITFIIKIKKECADAAYKVVFDIFDYKLESDDDEDCKSSGDEAEWLRQGDSTI